MPKLIGPITYTGTFNNMTAYKMRGSDKIILRMKGGASKEQIKNSTCFAQVRKNNAEFGASAKAAARIRLALTYIKHLADPGSTGRLNSLCKTILKQDSVNLHGQREVSFAKHGQLLEGFNFNKELLLNSVIRHPFSCTVNRDTGSATLLIPALIPGVNFYSPPQHHLCRFIIVLGLVPDITFKTDSYLPIPQIGSRETVHSEWFSTRNQLDEQRFELQFQNFTGLENSNSMILAIGVEYGQAVSNKVIERVPYAGCASILATG